MLPPINEHVLENNPNFAALHTVLKNNILTPAGSTKKHSAEKERAAISEALKQARIRAAKKNVIRIALNSMDLSPPTTSSTKGIKTTSKPLPTELLELILLISARLSMPNLSKSSIKVLESTAQWSALNGQLATVGSLISTYLHNQVLALVKIETPTTNPSYLHRGIPKLVDSVTTTQVEIASKKADLATRRTALVGKTTNLLGTYNMAIALIVRILEQTKHGSLSRLVKTKAEYLNASATQVNLEIKEKGIRGEKMVYTPEAIGALSNYMENLRDGQERLGERERGAKRELWGYGVGREDGEKEKVMKEIARVYGELAKESREVTIDVERLKGK